MDVKYLRNHLNKVENECASLRVVNEGLKHELCKTQEALDAADSGQMYIMIEQKKQRVLTLRSVVEYCENLIALGSDPND